MILTPKYLGELGKAKWKSLVRDNPHLAEHTDCLGLLCKSWEIYLRCHQEVDTGDINITSNKGMIRANPAIKTADEAWKQIVAMSKLLGITPDNDSIGDPPPLDF